MIYRSESAEETKKIAALLAEKLKIGDVIALWGDLGAGKTAFVEGLAKALGTKDPVSSPTFTIINCYRAKFPIYHFDVYRIDNSDEMYDIGYEDYIWGDGISVIEWPERIEDILPDDRYDITILKDYDKHDDFRYIRIEGRGRYADTCDRNGG